MELHSGESTPNLGHVGICSKRHEDIFEESHIKSEVHFRRIVCQIEAL